MVRTALALALSLGILAPPAFAGPPVSCHCFTDRAYDPARPAAADPYALATAQNSLLAAAFGLAKQEVVRARMSGTAAEDLWVAHAVGRRAGRPAETLLGSRAGTPSWKAALAALGVDAKRLGSRLAAAAQSGDAALAGAAADETIEGWLGADPATLRALRDRGATTPEAILATLLARRSGAKPLELLADARAGRVSWGAALARAGLAPSALEDELRTARRERR